MKGIDCKAVIVSRKDIDVSNRIDPEFFDEQFTKLEDELASVPHFSWVCKEFCVNGKMSYIS